MTPKPPKKYLKIKKMYSEIGLVYPYVQAVTYKFLLKSQDAKAWGNKVYDPKPK